jgi:DNA polymerase III delta prime subunit
VVDPLAEYYEGVKELIRGRCGDGVVLILSPPLTWADKLAKEFGKDKVRHYIIGSRSGRKEVEALRGILEEIRKGGGLASDGKLMSKLRALLGDNLVGGVKPDCIIPYYISWDDARDYANKMDVDKEIKNALDLITKGFESRGRRITWFGLDYVPEVLVEEAMSAKSEDVERWIDAYLHIISKLGLDEGFSDRVRRALKEFAKGHFGDAIKALLSSLKVPEPYTQAAVSTLSFIAILLGDKRDVFGEVIDVLTHLRSLSRDGGLSVLGRLIVYKLAVSMGLNHEDVYNALTSIGGLGVDELRSIVSSITERVKEIEERLRVIDEIKRWTKENKFEVYDDVDFEDGKAYPGILVRGNELVIGGSTVGESILETHRVIVSGNFNALKDEVLKRLNDEGVVVLVGPRGIGKTTLAAYVTWALFREGGLGFMVNVKNLEEKGTEFTGFISQYLDKHWGEYGDLLVVYDPSTTKTYSLADKKTEVPEGISNTIDTLLRYIAEDEGVRGRVRLLVVLPTDIYQALSQDLRDRLGKYVLDLEERGFLKDPEFIAAVIREYARGCSIDYGEAKALAREILGKFSEGYTLIARLAGTLIASKYKCRVDDVERIIKESGGNAHYFILRYINTLFKIHEDPKAAETLVEVFALRRPFVSMTRPGIPILTPGVIELIGKNEKREAKLLYSAVGGELRGWLAIRQHDLIEEAIMKLLDCIVSENEGCKGLGDALKPWKTIGETLREVSEKVKDVDSAVEYFVDNYGKEFITTLGSFSNCWKRAAYIIGHALAGRILVTGPEDLSVFLPEDLRKSVVESLGDALNRCEIDDYLLVGNVIPPLIWYLIKNHTHALTEAFVDKYDEAIVEVSRVRDIVKYRDRGISSAEAFYGLGLASIIANAVESGKPIESNDADKALHIASFAIQYVASTYRIIPILSALRPLRGKAPQRYLELLAPIPEIENLDSDTVRYIFDGLNEVLDNYGDVVRGYAWSLVHAIIAYANLLRRYRIYLYFSDEVKGAVRKIADLLNELDKFKTSLGVIAWAYALAPALEYEDIMKLMMETLRINKVDKVIDKASEVAKELGRLRKKVKELIRDEEFVGYIKSRFVKADEGTVKIVILEAASLLKHALAIYRLDNDELDEVEELSNEAAKEYREIGDYENYLTARSWALRAEAIKGSLVDDELTKLRNEFQRLYEETFNEEHFKLTAQYLGVASGILGDYLVSLALTGDGKKINELLEEHWLVLRINEQVSVLTRLVLNALLGSKDRKDQLGSELKDKLGINSWELINAFGSDIYMYIEFLPALRVALGIAKPKDETAVCKLIKDSMKRRDCRGAVLAAVDDSDAIWWLRWELIYNFYERILEKERSGWLRELGFDANVLISEFGKLVGRLDGKSLVQLIAPETSTARLALMLYALVNGNEKLAKAHALMGTTDLIRESEFISWFWFISMIISKSKLLTRLFLEAYRACCDLKNELFRLAIARLFFYHI